MPTPFALFGLPATFALDLKVLERAQRELGKTIHPDTASDPSERRALAEQSTLANEGYRALRDPVTRAELLFQLAGVATGDGHEPKPTAAFLMDMLEKREALAEARTSKDRATVEALAAEIRAQRNDAEAALAALFSGVLPSPLDAQPALVHLGSLRYYRRFLEEATATLDEWDDA